MIWVICAHKFAFYCKLNCDVYELLRPSNKCCDDTRKVSTFLHVFAAKLSYPFRTYFGITNWLKPSMVGT